jgi:organic radical activating enzyme
VRPVVTAKATNECMNRCDYCVSESPGCTSHTRLDFGALIEWLDMYRPGAEVHVSGGEPLLCDDIESSVQKLIDAGYAVTMTINGQLIRKRTELLDMPLKWIVTLHQEQISVDDFCNQIEPLRSKPGVLIQTVKHMESHEQSIDYLTRRFEGFLFLPKWAEQYARTWSDWGE